MTSTFHLSDSARETIVNGLLVWMVLAFSILYIFRNRYCVVCGGRLRFRERAMDDNGYDLCDQHRRQSQRVRDPEEDDDDFNQP